MTPRHARKLPRGRRGVLGAALVAAAAVCLAVPTHGLAALRADFVGIVSEDVLAGSDGYRDAQLAKQRATGIGLIRQTFSWSSIEKAPGVYDFSAYDPYVGQLAVHGMRLLPILFDPPPFQSAGPTGTTRGTYPPRDNAAMGRFAAAVVDRYGRSGSFWREHPEIPFLPVTAWQIWNEPNLKAYWATGPSPRAYTRLLKAVSAAIKRVDRHAEILTAGLPDSNKGLPLVKFVEGMYRAGAKSGFDTLALNAHAATPADVVADAALIRKLMNARRDRRARLWITEIGWASGGPPGRFTVTKKQQATRIRELFALLAPIRSKLRLRGVVYYAWRDAAPYAARTDFWGLHTGLLDLAGRPKPALAAFRRAVASTR